MSHDPQRHNRQSHRLKGYDYSLSAPYFVTLCAEKSLCLFGKVEGQRMLPNEQGKMIESWLTEMPNKFPGILIDCFQVMPNHLHAVMVNIGCSWDMAARCGLGVDNLDLESANENEGTPLQVGVSGQAHPPVKHPTLGHVIQWFKTMSTNNDIRGVRESGWKPFLRDFGSVIISITLSEMN